MGVVIVEEDWCLYSNMTPLAVLFMKAEILTTCRVGSPRARRRRGGVIGFSQSDGGSLSDEDAALRTGE